MSTKKRTVSAVFETHTAANRAMEKLLAAGFKREDISLLMSEATRVRYYPEEVGAEGTALGVGVGAIVGGLIGIAAAAPGGIFVAGPLAGFLGGAAVGATGGGLMGALVDLGVPEADARIYRERIDAGGVLVAVQTSSGARATEAEQIMREAGSPMAKDTMIRTEQAG